MLRLLLLALLLPLAACSAPDEAEPHDPEADRLLAAVTGDAWDDLFGAPEATYLRTASGVEAPTDTVPNPLPAFLSDEPAYLDAAARDRYRTRIVGDTVVAGRRAVVAEARFVAGGGRSQPVRRVRAAVDPMTGTLLAIEVVRSFDSALFDEESRLVAALGARGDALVLDHAAVETATDVPLSDARRDRVSWRRQR